MIKWFDKSKLPAPDEKISFVITKRKRKHQEVMNNVSKL